MSILIGVLLVVGLGVIGALAMRHRFMAHLDGLERELQRLGPTPVSRVDLPPGVVALAARMGAGLGAGSRFAVFAQNGQMWPAPGGKPMDFTARQTVRIDAPEFLWRATMGLPTGMKIADYLVAGTGGLEVKLLGIFPVARIVDGAGAAQGEALRYLAELPLNPDAILANRALDWTVIDPTTIKVATGVGAARGEVTLDLDDRGLVIRISTPSRIYAEKKGRITRHPWRGRFWDYQSIGGRFIPRQGEVAWVLDTGDFIYWRGRILSWKT
ncbi:MAG: DUF6544 family protein [Opitutaceae bacterium]